VIEVSRSDFTAKYAKSAKKNKHGVHDLLIDTLLSSSLRALCVLRGEIVLEKPIQREGAESIVLPAARAVDPRRWSLRLKGTQGLRGDPGSANVQRPERRGVQEIARSPAASSTSVPAFVAAVPRC
jgi:hypothetical protein